MNMRIDEEIWCYIGKRVELDNVLPSQDELFDRFPHCFDVAEKELKSYVSCTDLDGVQIDWEGSLI